MKCFICRPRFYHTEGADHCGVDYFLRCDRCGTRTEAHVEGLSLTDEIKGLLRKEWRAGRIALNEQGGR